MIPRTGIPQAALQVPNILSFDWHSPPSFSRQPYTYKQIVFYEYRRLQRLRQRLSGAPEWSAHGGHTFAEVPRTSPKFLDFGEASGRCVHLFRKPRRRPENFGEVLGISAKVCPLGLTLLGPLQKGMEMS